MRNRVFIALFLLLVPAYSCKSPSSPGPERLVEIMIEGVVTESKTGAPIAGAIVRRLESWYAHSKVLQEVSCDGDGRYSLAFMTHWSSDGMVWNNLFAYANGYSMDPRDLNGLLGYAIKCIPEVQVVNFKLIPL